MLCVTLCLLLTGAKAYIWLARLKVRTDKKKKKKFCKKGSDSSFYYVEVSAKLKGDTRSLDHKLYSSPFLASTNLCLTCKTTMLELF